MIAPLLINPGDVLELQVLSAGLPTKVSVVGRVADLVVAQRKALPYPPGSGSEGEMLPFDRFMWFVFFPAFIIGVGLSLALSGERADTDRTVILVGTALALVAYAFQAAYLVRRRRRWRP